ncbi:Rho GTPase-activating protein [Striga asiatica]|uniref:Rho GTPase-activating protein n=1 Tax=Striga asiatica TaxID=4170 RepID=A0A5A7Q9N2_STRAF|nr:Rho GTPase-activating protein [Striga asiatica]
MVGNEGGSKISGSDGSRRPKFSFYLLWFISQFKYEIGTKINQSVDRFSSNAMIHPCNVEDAPGLVGKMKGCGSFTVRNMQREKMINMFNILPNSILTILELLPDPPWGAKGPPQFGADGRRMEIGSPSNVRHVAHVTFDRFTGFLGLPVEFEPEKFLGGLLAQAEASKTLSARRIRPVWQLMVQA